MTSTAETIAAATAGEGTGRREQRRALRQELGRNQILDAAEEVFGAKGFHNATIKEIAARAEFSVGAVYGFFENKDDLFARIYLRRGGEFMDEMRTLMAENHPPRGQLHRLAEFQIGFMRTHPAFGRLFLRDRAATVAEPSTAVHEVVAERFTEAMDLQADLFTRGAEYGDLLPGQPAVLARLFSGLVGAYQATDPAVTGAPTDAPAMPLEDFLAIIDRTFAP